MKLKNEKIIALVNLGVMGTGTSTLSCEQSYKVIKFRRLLKQAFESIREAEKSIIDECGIIINEKNEINGTDEAKLKFSELDKVFLSDETELGEVHPISFSDWCELKKENKHLAHPFVEDTLEGIFWLLPEEKKDEINNQ